MLAEQGAILSTRGAALEYAPPMRSTSLLIPVFVLLVGACQDPEPENLPGEFGEPCVPGESVGTPDGCASGLQCDAGYCEEECVEDSDCQPVEGWEHVCLAGLCQLICDDTCPSSLGVQLMCVELGNSGICRADDGS